MPKLRLRTKLLFSLLLISTTLTCATLLIVHGTIRAQVRREIFDDLRNSVVTFRNVQRQREVMLSRSARLVSDLPSLRALMTTQDAATIQDASQGTWQLTGSDLFVLANRTGRVVALHATAPGFSQSMAEEQIRSHATQPDMAGWWFGAGRLYQVFLQPIYFGPAAENRLLGVVAIGYEIDERLAREVSRIANSQVAIRYGDSLILSTLSPSQEKDLAAYLKRTPAAGAGAGEVVLGGEEFLATTLSLDDSTPSSAQLAVLKSYDQASAFLVQLNRLLLALGLSALFSGTILIYLISRTFTRPLESLAAGVKALERGDYVFPLERSGDDEVAVVTNAFVRMRQSLHLTQQKLLETERLATIGLMASSISHDLRHPLTAILANAEFLCEGRLNGAAREDLYQEIRTAVHRMTDLIESLLEFSRGRESLQVTQGRPQEALMRALRAVQAQPQFQTIKFDMTGDAGEAWFDHRRLERVFYNLLLNACEASPPDGKVDISFERDNGELRIRVADQGPGIAEEIRSRLFDPFVSYGKENGTGLGLTISQKITQDHGGTLRVASSSPQGTVFELKLPLNHPPASGSIVHRVLYAAPVTRRGHE